MNHALAREIYGANPWHIDPVSFGVLQNILKDAKNGVYDKGKKNNTPTLAAFSNTKIVTRPWQLNSTEEFNGVGVINIDGAITNSGGDSSYGMLELSSMMIQMSRDSRVKGFIILGNSGDASSMAVETMGEAIDQFRKTKPVYGLIEKGGTAASAMYMILSYTEKIFAQSEMSIVGSNGTMIQFEGIPANKEIDGVKYIRLYATKSIKKNEAYEEAINNDNYDIIVNDLLNPLNERANSKTLQNRPQLQGTNFDTGVEVFAKDGVGTYIDGFASFSEVVSMILQPNNNNKLNSNNMTKEELKSQHPTVYNEIYNEGVSAEKDRVGAWMAHLETDSKSVVEGIESGLAISNTAREKFIVKSNSMNKINKLAEASAAPVVTEESETVVDKANSELEETAKELSNIFKGL